jgi:hypothetical protein
VNELFIEGTQPDQTDDWHWLVALDTRNGLLAGPGCPPQYTTRRFYTLYPAEAQDWARRQGIPQPPEAYSSLCPDEPTVLSTFESSKGPPKGTHEPTLQLILTSPDQGSRYRLSPEIPQEMQQIAVAVRPADDVTLGQVTLFADGRPLATLPRPPYQVLWPMTVGTHLFTAAGVDIAGNELQGNSVVIEVLE